MLAGWTDDSGQDLAEYALLLSLVVLVAMAGVNILADAEIWNVWTQMSSAL